EALKDALAEAVNRLEGATESVIVVIPDSRTYPVDFEPDPGVVLALPAGRHLEIRAANGERPVLVLPRFNLVVEGGKGSSFEVNGLLFTGLPLIVRGELEHLNLRHTTLVPGWGFRADGRPLAAGARSLFVESGSTAVLVERSIVGALSVDRQARVEIADSIVDAQERSNLAYSESGDEPGGPLTVRRSTVVGGLHTQRLDLAESSLFLGTVVAEQRQQGCVRFSHVPLGSRVPRRYRCQPEVPAEASPAEARRLAARVFPRFTSLSYGDPGYCQLDWRGPREILRGAEDESEMGVFSSLLQPRREDALRVRLDEYLRLGLEAGILFVT
ncbi:MAG: hypothetical protein KDD47_04650, partial [Acidobacteria bacterium]|nr:hypothetical protein [Acidobacteriota bacterium]